MENFLMIKLNSCCIVQKGKKKARFRSFSYSGVGLRIQELLSNNEMCGFF